MNLFETSYFALFAIITIGIIIGKLKIKGISLELSAVIFVALIFGHFGVIVHENFQKIGLLMFIYSIGMQAGPGFFTSFRKGGLKIISIAVVLVITGAVLTMLAVLVVGVDGEIAVGLFAGALTSTPGLAAAIESTHSELASIGYGISYPFGVIGVIIFVHLIPRIFKIDISKEEILYEKSKKDEFPEILHKHFVVENTNICGQTIGQLKIRTMTGANVSRIKHKEAAVIPIAETILNKGDLIRAVGTIDALDKIKLLVGPVTDHAIELKISSDIQWVSVTNKAVVNKTLVQLNLFDNYGATVTRIRRTGVDITPKSTSHVRFGDKLLIACSGNTPAVIKLLGNESKKLSETDFLPISAGIVLGVLIGVIEIPFPGGMSFKLGLTGGVLITALVLSRLGKTGPIIWNVSGPANQLLRQLGLLFFLAAVGTNAGSNLMATISTHGAKLFIVGIVITLVPMLVATIIGHFIFKINFLSLLGVLTGGMTSTPGLSAIDALSDSNASNIAYATVYPVAMVILIICTQFLSLL